MTSWSSLHSVFCYVDLSPQHSTGIFMIKQNDDSYLSGAEIKQNFYGDLFVSNRLAAPMCHVTMYKGNHVNDNRIRFRLFYANLIVILIYTEIDCHQNK